MGPKIFSTLDKFPHYTILITLILLSGTIEFVHIEQISALYKFHCTYIIVQCMFCNLSMNL
jgi:hypothetical protein